MPFVSTVLANGVDLPAGEVIKSTAYNVSVYERFENGLIEGRFAKLDTGSADLLDASATPKIIGIVKRKITGEIGTGVYATSGLGIDQVAEIIDFGWATVTVTSAAVPTKLAPVYAINLNTAEAGKATQDSAASGAVIVPDTVFWEAKAPGVWLVRISRFLTGAA